MVKWAYILILVFGAISCKKNNPKSTIRVDLTNFSEVELNSNFDVYLIEDSTFWIEIEGFEKSIAKVEYSIDSDILRLVNKQKNKFLFPETNKVTIYIHSKPLRKLTSNETCFIRTTNPITSPNFGLIFKSKANYAEIELAGKTFYYWNNFPCGGKLTLSGTTEELKIWNTAILSVDAKQLVANYSLVENSSKGLCEVNVITKFEYSLLGDGNIELYGNPPIQNQLQNTGKGKLIVH